jgi:hypothetical protein
MFAGVLSTFLQHVIAVDLGRSAGVSLAQVGVRLTTARGSADRESR